MIIIKDGVESTKQKINAFSYAKQKYFFSPIILRLTRYLRAVNAGRYIQGKKRLLDIGCGDGYFLRRLHIPERYGIDKLFGDEELIEKYNFPDNYFDYVTMLAVIEHVTDPRKIIFEIYRILKPGGKLILTTPKKISSSLINMYVKGIEQHHKQYFTLSAICALTAPIFTLEDYRTFMFSLNQIFCLKKMRKE